MQRDRLPIRLIPIAAAMAMLAGCCHSYPRLVWTEPAACPPPAPAAMMMPPQDQPIMQEGYMESSNGYLKQGPVVAGTLLSAPTHKIASEAAVVLKQQNEKLSAEKKDLDERVAKLTKDLELNHEALAQASGEMEKAQQELASTRTELQTWQHQLAELYTGFRNSEQQQSKTLGDMEQEIQRIIQSQLKRTETTENPEPAPAQKFESVKTTEPVAAEKPNTASAPTPPKS